MTKVMCKRIWGGLVVGTKTWKDHNGKISLFSLLHLNIYLFSVIPHVKNWPLLQCVEFPKW